MLKPLPPVSSMEGCVVFLTVSSVSGLVPGTEEVHGHCLRIERFLNLSLRGT